MFKLGINLYLIIAKFHKIFYLGLCQLSFHNINTSPQIWFRPLQFFCLDVKAEFIFQGILWMCINICIDLLNLLTPLFLMCKWKFAIMIVTVCKRDNTCPSILLLLLVRITSYFLQSRFFMKICMLMWATTASSI